MEVDKGIAYRESFNEFDLKNIILDQEEMEVPLLTEMVRNHYLNYLEKQLTENFLKCYNMEIEIEESECSEKYKSSIKKTAHLLEDKAVEACRIAQRYQRAMVKIIAIVRRSTQEQRLISPLESTILNFELTEPQTKATQTEAEIVFQNHQENTQHIEHKSKEPEKDELNEDSTTHEMTLDEKIEIFKKHLHNGHTQKSESIKRNHHHNLKKSHKSERQHPTRRHRHHHRPYKENKPHPTAVEKVNISPADTVVTPIKSPHPSLPTENSKEKMLRKSINNVVADMENSNDSVAVELARLFSEEKTELDEIFGIDPNQEPDDPQICKILKEIEQAQIGVGGISQQQQQPQESITTKNDKILPSPTIHLNNISNHQEEHTTPKVIQKCEKDLSNSLWPCELFMQKRKLSESLARLLEEDLRWHDIMKWKFLELFGEDSDDEFTPCSPSIELDDILMGSCVKRISPWVVKHLMKPMKHGLIGNRFVFKKLAKHIARSIITENQYPDELIIKGCIENYFCLHQAVMTVEDLQDVPSISLNEI
ncbi:uncharacterized protein [Musca autumnalis]|uniref:uncharacterized protein n=1 Tax=Musca autumnalis TaxID=221902 RepID=UPI003CF50682